MGLEYIQSLEYYEQKYWEQNEFLESPNFSLLPPFPSFPSFQYHPDVKYWMQTIPLRHLQSWKISKERRRQLIRWRQRNTAASFLSSTFCALHFWRCEGVLKQSFKALRRCSSWRNEKPQDMVIMLQRRSQNGIDCELVLATQWRIPRFLLCIFCFNRSALGRGIVAIFNSSLGCCQFFQWFSKASSSLCNYVATRVVTF